MTPKKGSPELLTQAEYARRRGCTRNAVHLAVRDGRIPTVGKMIDPDVADKAWAQNTAPTQGSANGGKPSSTASLNAQRAEREGWRAKLDRLEYEEKVGLLVPAADVERQAFEAARAVRDAVMQVAKDVSSDLAPAMTPLEVDRRLSVALRQALGRAQAALVGDDGVKVVA